MAEKNLGWKRKGITGYTYMHEQLLGFFVREHCQFLRLKDLFHADANFPEGLLSTFKVILVFEVVVIQ